MKNNKKKYALLIILILFIAFFSSQCMMTHTNTGSKKTVAVILPYTYNKENSRILDAIRDYAYNNSIILDVWHEKAFLQMSYLPSSLMKNKIMQLASC